MRQFDGRCDGMQLVCDDDSGPSTTSRGDLELRAGASVLVTVDGDRTRTGTYVLGIDVL